METRTKKIIAREILILVLPIILLIVISFGLGIYFTLSVNRIDKTEKSLLDEIKINIDHKIDSINKADSVETLEILKRMKDSNESNENIELVKSHLKSKSKTRLLLLEKYKRQSAPEFEPSQPYTVLSSDDEIKNLYGDTLKLSSIEQEIQNLKIKRAELNKSTVTIFGTEPFNGFIVIVYVCFLIIAYPIRLLIYLLIWSIKTVTTK